MGPEVQRQEDSELREQERELMAHRYLYYVECAPVITDEEYDQKERAFLEQVGEESLSPMSLPGSDLVKSYSDDEINLANELAE